jgi:magnesium-transporting ATPase (P-type)
VQRRGLRRGAGAAHGDPTELALLSAAEQAGVEVASERLARPRLGSIPFDADRKFMATLHQDRDGGTVLYVKGAPEVLLPRCRHVNASRVQQEVDSLAESGQRVLLFAARDGPPPDKLDDAVAELRLLGLQGLIDPPRPEAFEAVEACRRAGVRVLMVTGDHPRTAVAVARSLGISADGALTGSEIEQLDEESFRPTARRVSVYARAAPKDKLKLVRALQADAEVVAVTGDGVNDAPALRQSALGVAMGRTGTATAKEAADMVLADDNFATLRAAIEEGRRVYDNLVKALAFVLPTSVGQALIIAVWAVPVAPERKLRFENLARNSRPQQRGARHVQQCAGRRHRGARGAHSAATAS